MRRTKQLSQQKTETKQNPSSFTMKINIPRYENVYSAVKLVNYYQLIYHLGR